MVVDRQTFAICLHEIGSDSVHREKLKDLTFSKGSRGASFGRRFRVYGLWSVVEIYNVQLGSRSKQNSQWVGWKFDGACLNRFSKLVSRWRYLKFDVLPCVECSKMDKLFYVDGFF